VEAISSPFLDLIYQDYLNYQNILKGYHELRPRSRAMFALRVACRYRVPCGPEDIMNESGYGWNGFPLEALCRQVEENARQVRCGL
jgi:hypothetical protein